MKIHQINLPMHKKITITINKEVYDALYRVIGRGKISQFLENLARPHVMQENLVSAYTNYKYWSALS